jgi:Transposase zinc-ribbon domain
MADFPRSLVEFHNRVPDEAAGVADRFAARWPHGFVCPACGRNKAWQRQTKAWTWQCAGGGKQTSVTAGTIMPPSKLPLTIWFWAADLMATPSNNLPRRRPGASPRCNCTASSLWARTNRRG